MPGILRLEKAARALYEYYEVRYCTIPTHFTSVRSNGPIFLPLTVGFSPVSSNIQYVLQRWRSGYSTPHDATVHRPPHVRRPSSFSFSCPPMPASSLFGPASIINHLRDLHLILTVPAGSFQPTYRPQSSHELTSIMYWTATISVHSFNAALQRQSGSGNQHDRYHRVHASIMRGRRETWSRPQR